MTIAIGTMVPNMDWTRIATVEGATNPWDKRVDHMTTVPMIVNMTNLPRGWG
jgi:hypothetical protein